MPQFEEHCQVPNAIVTCLSPRLSVQGERLPMVPCADLTHHCYSERVVRCYSCVDCMVERGFIPFLIEVVLGAREVFLRILQSDER